MHPSETKARGGTQPCCRRKASRLAAFPNHKWVLLVLQVL